MRGLSRLYAEDEKQQTFRSQASDYNGSGTDICTPSVVISGADFSKPDYPARKTALFAFLALQVRSRCGAVHAPCMMSMQQLPGSRAPHLKMLIPGCGSKTWVVAVGAMHMQAAAREAVKLEHYCQLEAWTASPLNKAGCDRSSLWAQFKVLGDMAAVLLGLLLSWSFMLLKSRLDEDQMTAVRCDFSGRVSFAKGGGAWKSVLVSARTRPARPVPEFSGNLLSCIRVPLTLKFCVCAEYRRKSRPL